MSKIHRVALVVGHSLDSRGAASSDGGKSEFCFNRSLVSDVQSEYITGSKNIECAAVFRNSYKTLPDKINKWSPHFIISFHCNAYDGKVSGTETLYYYKSIKGKRLAGIVQHRLLDTLGLPDRGIKPRTVEDRGGYLVRYTNAPCVIAEPFFIDNDDDLARATEVREQLVMAYVTAIRDYANEGE